MLKINTTAKYAELKFDDKSDLYPFGKSSVSCPLKPSDSAPLC